MLILTGLGNAALDRSVPHIWLFFYVPVYGAREHLQADEGAQPKVGRSVEFVSMQTMGGHKIYNSQPPEFCPFPSPPRKASRCTTRKNGDPNHSRTLR